jgi:hypothetical protein
MAGDTSGQLELKTNNGTTAVTIDTSQNVGVGTASPSAKLEVAGGDLRVTGTGTGNIGITLRRTAGTTSDWYQYIPSGADAFVWFQGGGVGAERMRINSSGNVGIGTSSPTQKLTVAGAINIPIDATNPNAGVSLWSQSGIGATLSGFNIAFNTGNDGAQTERMRIDTSGKLLVGTTTVNGTEILQLKAAGVQWAAGPNTTNGNFDVLNGSGTGVYLANGGTSWIGLSDETVKDIIEPINGAVSKVNTLRSVIGKYKIDEEGTRRSFLIAQDVQAVFPEAVNTNHDGKLGISYTDVIPLLVAAIKELNAKVDAQALEIKALKGVA